MLIRSDSTTSLSPKKLNENASAGTASNSAWAFPVLTTSNSLVSKPAGSPWGMMAIVLSSSVNMIEIWDKNQYETSVADTLKGFGYLAEEVMGNQPKDSADGVS